jgi:hypothetical protein
MNNPGHILSPHADNSGWEPHEAPPLPDAVGTKTFIQDEGKIGVYREQDVEPIRDRALAIAANNGGWSKTRELRHVAELPMVNVEQYCSDKGITLNEFLANPVHARAMMADPALRDFNIEANTVHRTFR